MSRDLFSQLLSIAARGGFKLGATLLTVAIFTGMITATQIMITSYVINAPIIQEITINPQFAVSKKHFNGSLRVEVASVTLNDTIITVFSTEDLAEYLYLIGYSAETSQLNFGEALISKDLAPFISNGTLTIKELKLKVSGFIESQKTILISLDTMTALKLESEDFYYGKSVEADHSYIAEAPSSTSLIHGISREVQNALSTIKYALYTILTLTCLVQALHVMNESKGVFKVYLAFAPSKMRLYSSLISMAICVSAASVILGYAIGVTTSASASAVLSQLLKLPYIKPSFNDALIFDLALAFTSSSIGLSVGYVEGYAHLSG